MCKAIKITQEKARPRWHIVFEMLGYFDYAGEVKPWCSNNCEHDVGYMTSPHRVVCESEADALLVYLRFK